MKKFINSPARVVTEMLDGLVALDPALKRLSGYNVVVRAEAASLRDKQVALISGGGSGHEPAHAGYVGAGMLSAAVAGEIFTSPSTEAVYAAIRAVAGKAGVLLIVKNYTGDRLNFGLAAEMARGEGIPVELVIVADDVALEESQLASGARGIAGVVLVHKVAGAVAASGADLAQVKAAAQAAAANLGSMGVSLSAGTSPMVGRPSFVLGDEEMELGLGIHGEPGVSRMPIKPADPLVKEMLERILAVRKLRSGDRMALLVNNLGSTTTMELAIVARQALAVLKDHGLAVKRAYAGTFLSSLDMAGFSLSVLRVDEERLHYLDAPTAAVAWPNAPKQPPVPADERILAVSLGEETGGKETTAAGKRSSISGTGEKLRRAIESACAALIAAEPRLTELDQKVGDGDLGVSMERGAKAVRQVIDGYPLDDPGATLEALSRTVRESLGGSSGPLYGVLLLRMAHTLRQAKSLNPAAWANAVNAACTAISELGGAQAGDRTMLDALIPFAKALQQETKIQKPLKDALEASVKAAELGAEATAQMAPRRGRSAYLGERTKGFCDPGAMAIAIELRAIVEALF